MCPNCKRADAYVIRKGFFARTTFRKTKVQRYLCKTCGKTFSTQTEHHTYRQRTSRLNQNVFLLLCSSVSERKIAFNVAVTPRTVSSIMSRLARRAREMHQDYLNELDPLKVVIFDDMETFEHTKCKPVSITVAVEDDTRRILCANTASMPAKGPLSRIARKRYGPRADDRPDALRATMQTIRSVSAPGVRLKSDESPRYPKQVRLWFPDSEHERHKGRRGCIVGQGELKEGGFDPLFALNHTCAMIRDNLKRLTRRTWCTTKLQEKLQDLLFVYIVYHNQRLERRVPCIA